MRTKLVLLLACLMILFSLPNAEAQVNPAASQRTKNIYSYLRNLKNAGATNRVLLGQQGNSGDGSWSSNWNYVYWELAALHNWERQLGMVAVDFGEQERWSAAGDLDYFASNGRIVSASWHAANPWTGGDSWDRTNGNLAELLPGGAKRRVWLAELDRIAEVLMWLQGRGRTVLWRPLHEMNGNWFWWGNRSSANYKALWRDMYNYFTRTKGLNNLLWVYAPNNKNSASIPAYNFYFPGARFIDIVGVDVYDDVRPTDPLSIYNYSALKAVAPGKPLICAEVGPSSSDGSVYWWDYAEEFKNKYPEIVAAVAWNDWRNASGTWFFKSIRGNQYDGVLWHQTIVTKEELPTF